MFWERQYFISIWASFSVNAHGLRHVTDKLASFFYLLVLADDTSTYSIYLSMLTLVHNTDAVYVCHDVLYLGTLYFFSLFLLMVSIGQTMCFCSDRFSLPVIMPRALAVSKQLARPGEVKT